MTGPDGNSDPIPLRAELEALTPSLLAWCHMRLLGRPAVDAEDLTQEILCRAMSRLSTFTGGNLGAWVFTIGKNVLLEQLRRRRRADRVRTADGHSSAYDAMDQVAAEMTTLTRRVAKRDDLQALLQMVRDLDPEDRELALLCGMEGQTCGAAAMQLGLSEDAATKRWQRLRKQLAARAPWLAD